MPMRILLCWTLLLLTVSACGPLYKTQLERTAGQLKAGMTKAEVGVLFKNFKSAEYNGGDLAGTILFQPEGKAERRVNYSPKNPGQFDRAEDCTVYFDKNGIIIGYNYGHS